MQLRLALTAIALLALPAAPRAEEAPPACEAGTALAPGLCLAGTVTGDGVANVTGGVRRGVAAVGQVRLDLTADLGALAGLDGWRVATSVIGVYGRQPTATRVGSLAPVSNIEALSTIRLFELWAERSFGEWGSLRFGQLAADAEFATAAGAANLVNGTFGWPVALAGALPSGGPAYPLATPGIRLALGDPEGGTGLRLGVFSGDPGGAYGEGTDPQRHNRHGTLFSTRGGAFYLAEAVTGAAAPEGDDAPRPWVLKLGGWYHTGGFDSVRFDDGGLSLADPASSGTPRRFGSNYGGYAVAEATLWRGEDSTILIFGRAFAQPGDRNAVDLQLDAGLAWRGPFGRGADTLSLGLSWARIGARSRDFDRDLVAFGTTRPVRSHETVLEINYDASVIEDRLALRPFVQALFNPAAGEPDERRDATRALPDAVVLGLRAVLTF
jgi:porin